MNWPFSARLILLIMIIYLWALPSALQAQSVDKIVITAVDAEQFPEITVSFRAIDGSNNIISNLNEDEVMLYENEQLIGQFNVEPQGRTPTTIVFVIDRGRQFNAHSIGISTIRDSMLQLTREGYFRDGYDTVAILVREVQNGNETTTILLPPTQSAQEYADAISRFNFQNSNGRTNGLTGVSDGRAHIAELIEVPGAASAAVIYIGTLIDDPDGWNQAPIPFAHAEAASAREQNIKIHVIHTQLEGQYAAPFRAMTQDSSGQYALLERSGNNRISLDRIYQDIVDQAYSYRLTYRSPSGDSGQRSVIIVAPGVPVDQDLAGFYSVTVQPPQLFVPQPQEAVNRRPQRGEDGIVVFQVDSIDIEVTVDWGNSLPRTINEADLVVDGAPVLTVPPSVTNNRFILTWDITDIENQSREVPILIRVRDELGFEVASTTIFYEIIATIPEGTAVLQSPSTPAPVPTPITLTVTPCEQDPTQFDCMLDRLTPIGLILLSMVVVVLTFFLIRKREQVVQVGQAARHQIDNFVSTMVSGPRRGRSVLAKLYVESARKELMGTYIDIYTNTTKLGRNPKLVQVQLIDEGDISTVSGLHCTIQYQASNKTFFITDNNSSSGTYLNQMPLEPNQPYPLHDGAIILLGELARRGAKLRFEMAVETDSLASPKGEIPEAIRQTSREGIITQIDDGPLSGEPQTASDTWKLPPPEDEDDSWLNDLSDK